jgi:hypothetical protein
MRTFVKYSPEGEISGVVKLDDVPDDAAHPFSWLGPREESLEVELDDELREATLFEICSTRRVDPAARRLIAPPSSRAPTQSEEPT